MHKRLAKLVMALLAVVAFQCGVLAAPTFASTGNGCGGKQQDVNWQEPSSNYVHHWLGYCADGLGDYQYYSGMDDRWSWGGAYHWISYEYLRTRAWSGPSLVYDASRTLYGSTQTVYLNTGWYSSWNGPQTDSWAHWRQDGVFDDWNCFSSSGF
jgi:hypothetical protein